MNLPEISKAEWTIMENLWERSPKTASEVAKSLAPKTGWSENTFRTMLTRLWEKGALQADENASGIRIFSPTFARETYVSKEGDSFLNRVFQGAAQPLLVHFTTQARLSPEEIEELKRLLDQKLSRKD